MGAYLRIGFVAEATIELPAGISKNKLLKEIEEYYPSDTYDCTESDGEIMLTLKPGVVQTELLHFVRQVYEDLHGDAGKASRSSAATGGHTRATVTPRDGASRSRR